MNVHHSAHTINVAIRFSLSALALVALAACSSPNSGIDKKKPPVGGTPAEFGFQYAQTIAKAGNCDQAMPLFICLGEQGEGWELAMHSGGMCALEAASVWTGPLQKRPGFFGKKTKVSFDKPYYRSKTALAEKGLSLLRMTATAGWPDSQVVMVRRLEGGTGPKDMAEAKLWLTRYDDNARRKIYGSNSLGKAIRDRLADIVPLPPDDPKWQYKRLVHVASQDPFCGQLIRTRPARSAPTGEATEEALPGQLPKPETIDHPQQRRRR